MKNKLSDKSLKDVSRKSLTRVHNTLASRRYNKAVCKHRERTPLASWKCDKGITETYGHNTFVFGRCGKVIKNTLLTHDPCWWMMHRVILAFWKYINVITDILCVDTGSWSLAGVERSLWELCGHMTIASIRCDRVLRKPCAHGQSYNCHMWKHHPWFRGMWRGNHGHFVDTGPVPMWQCITETVHTVP